MMKQPKMLAEWHEQEAIILAWPDQQTDWRPWLDSVRQTYKQLIRAISESGTGVILLVRATDIEQLKSQFEGYHNLLLVSADYNDTWCRDYAFLTCWDGENMIPVEFTFNGWGNKFDASKDNQINQKVLAALCANKLQTSSMVVEGGALEIDQNGHLLSTAMCLANPQRNGEMSLQEYEQTFKSVLGATKVTCLEHGHLEGDDTDGHIDTLVRYTPSQGLVIQSCYNRPTDSHFAGLSSLVEECRAALPEHRIFELPLPYLENDEGERLPASYANYLINNEQILCPTYRVPEDDIALQIIGRAYPDKKIVAIDSFPLVQQFGSVHCISMQVPKQTLKPEVVAAFKQHVTVWQ
ncbi:agmatine deiminase family protein [Aliiglaciecola litoralis]|uniref:Agmatine deiminase family protein n=1 Tax=Aliiglaciecola litoralis TaxID=582857 RepID=A0ABP3X6A7_9ALTE